MVNSSLNGVGTALITPLSGAEIDVPALTRLVQYNLQEGVDFLVPLGTTGETSTLSDKECRLVLDTVLSSTNGKTPVVCGMFAKNNTRQVMDAIRAANLDGLHSILLASPYYNKPSQAGLLAHYTAIADSSPLPIVLYNVPSRTSVNILAETTLQLAEHPNIIGVKEASGDFNLIMQILKYKPKDFAVLSGDDALTIPMISCGSTGVISVISNAYPGLFSKAIHAALNGDFVTANVLHQKLFDLHKWLYIEGNPVGIKACLNLKGYCEDTLRLPLVPLSAGNKAKMKDVMQLIG